MLYNRITKGTVPITYISTLMSIATMG